jgi:hypothetical protein
MKAISLKSLNLTKKEIFNAPAICQDHFGDFLKKEIFLNKEETEKVRVWANHPENVKEGSPKIEIGYCGKENAYTWQTVKKYS